MATPEKTTKSFFKNNPFFSVTEKEEPIAPQTVAQPTMSFTQNFAPSAPTFQMPAPVVVPDNGANADQEYLDHFMKFMESKNFAGLDYLEFANTLHKMYEKSGASLPEANLYELAFVSFEAQGITSAVLLKTAQQYIDLVTEHRKEFDKHLTNDGSKLVQDKMAENAQLEKSNSDATLMITNLQQQIANIQASVSANAQTIQSNNVLIQSEQERNTAKQRKFVTAFNVVINKITGDIQKIRNYIK